MIVQNKSDKSGLSSALGRFKLQFKGRPHRADADAENTLILFFELISKEDVHFMCIELYLKNSN